MLGYKRKIQNIKEIQKLQIQEAERTGDDYLVGMCNGMEIALALLEGRDPAFLSVVKEPVVKRVDEAEKPVKRTIASGKRRVGYADIVVSSKGTKHTKG